MNDNAGRYRTFLAVSDAGSISGAARRLFITQPAVSAEIAALEHSLGVCLFLRTNRGVRLTEAGAVLSEYVRRAFSLLEAGEEKLRELSGLQSGTLRIGASDMTLRFFLLDYISKFHTAYPNLHLTVTNAPTPRTLDALRDGSIDFGVVSGPLAGGEADLCLRPLREIRDIFVCEPHHPLAGKADITREELAAYPLILLERGSSTRRYLSAWLGEGFPPPAIEPATSDLVLEFAKRGLGVAALVEDFAKEALAAGQVKKLSLQESPPPRRFYLVTRRNLPLSAAAQKMMELLEDGCED